MKLIGDVGRVIIKLFFRFLVFRELFYLLLCFYDFFYVNIILKLRLFIKYFFDF